MKRFDILSQSVPSKHILTEEPVKAFNKKMEKVRLKAAQNEMIAIERASKVLILRSFTKEISVPSSLFKLLL